MNANNHARTKNYAQMHTPTKRDTKHTKKRALKNTENTKKTQTRMVCVPAFGLTGEAVLLDLDTLDCTPLRFSTAIGGDGEGDWGGDSSALEAEEATD